MQPSHLTLNDKIALITGAAGDIGMAMAMRFAQAGARLALLDRDGERLAQRVAQAALPGERVLTLACDVTLPAAVELAVRACVEHYGGLNVAVNNAAAVTPLAPVADLALDAWNEALAVNLTGAFLVARACLGVMRAARSGVIINVASQLGHVTTAGRAPYSATKAALLSLTRSIALDHAADGIRAVSLSPGAIGTSRLTGMLGDMEKVNAALAPLYPLGRIGTADEIAQAAVFLASDAASFITGSDLLVDGGYTAQ